VQNYNGLTLLNLHSQTLTTDTRPTSVSCQLLFCRETSSVHYVSTDSSTTSLRWHAATSQHRGTGLRYLETLALATLGHVPLIPSPVLLDCRVDRRITNAHHQVGSHGQRQQHDHGERYGTTARGVEIAVERVDEHGETGRLHVTRVTRIRMRILVCNAVTTIQTTAIEVVLQRQFSAVAG